jgi:hypothetical protein
MLRLRWRYAQHERGSGLLRVFSVRPERSRASGEVEGRCPCAQLRHRRSSAVAWAKAQHCLPAKTVHSRPFLREEREDPSSWKRKGQDKDLTAVCLCIQRSFLGFLSPWGLD